MSRYQWPGWRLLLLLCWIMVVCCVLYASIRSSVSDSWGAADPSSHLGSSGEKRLRRFSSSSSTPENATWSSAPSSSAFLSSVIGQWGQGYGRSRPGQGQCYVKSGPTSEDLTSISKALILSRSGRPDNTRLLHCSAVLSCGRARDNDSKDTETRFLVDCRSPFSPCALFNVRFRQSHKWNFVSFDSRNSRKDDDIHVSLSRQELSNAVTELLQRNSSLTEKDVNNFIEVQCESASQLYSLKLELSLDVVASKCRVPKPRTDPDTRKKEMQRRDEEKNDFVDMHHPASREGEDQEKKALERVNVHILFVRFLSHWELSLRLPGLLSWLDEESKGKNRGMLNVMSFDKHQATTWREAQTLSRLLEGESSIVGKGRKLNDRAAFPHDRSLLHALKRSGHCLRLNDLSCSSSEELRDLIKKATSWARKGEIECPENDSAQQNEIDKERLCSVADNITVAELRSLMTSMLVKSHEQYLGFDAAERSKDKERINQSASQMTLPMFSVSVLNTNDFTDFLVLDSVLKNFLFTLLSSHQRSAEERDQVDTHVLLLGDVGNPTYLRFDQSVRLQSQASNPATLLVTFTSKETSREGRDAAGGKSSRRQRADRSLGNNFDSGGKKMTRFEEAVVRLNSSLFSMSDVHDFVKTLVSFNEAEERRPAEHRSTAGREQVGRTAAEDGLQNKDSAHLTRGKRTACAGYSVEPPFTCLCEDGLVAYENDTVMVGFAELAVNLINARLQREVSGRWRHGCSALKGLSFTDAYVGQSDQKRRILFRLQLQDDLIKERMFRNVALDLWDMHKTPSSEVNFFDDLHRPNSVYGTISLARESGEYVDQTYGNIHGPSDVMESDIDDIRQSRNQSAKLPRKLFKDRHSETKALYVESSLSSLPTTYHLSPHVLRFDAELSQMDQRLLKTLCKSEERLEVPSFLASAKTSSSAFAASASSATAALFTHEDALLRQWSLQDRHFGRRAKVLEIHDRCLYLLVRDFVDSVSVEAANVCQDRRYTVELHLRLINMVSLSALPMSADVGQQQKVFMAAIVKESYSTPSFAYKLHPEFDTIYV